MLLISPCPKTSDHFAASRHRRGRNPAANAFADGDQVRSQASHSIAQNFPVRPYEDCTSSRVNKQSAAPRAIAPAAFNHPCGGKDETRGPQVGLDDQPGQAAGAVGAHGVFNVIEAEHVAGGRVGLERAAVAVRERDANGSGQRGPIAFLGPGNPPAARGGEGAAVETTIETDDFELAGLPLHDADGAFRDLAARAEEKTFVQMRRQDGNQLLRGFHAPRMQALVIVQKLGGRFLHGLHQVRMAVPDVGHQHAGGPVDERVAVDVGHHHAGGVVPGDLRLVTGALRFDARPASKQILGSRAGQRSLHRCYLRVHLFTFYSLELHSSRRSWR